MLTLTRSRTQPRVPPSQAEIERRRGFRVTQNRPVKIFESSVSRYFGGQTQDVSATGLRMELPSSVPLRPGKLVSIHIGLNANGQALANRRQMIPARIVWVDRSSDITRRTQSAGIEFIASTAAKLDAA